MAHSHPLLCNNPRTFLLPWKGPRYLGKRKKWWHFSVFKANVSYFQITVPPSGPKSYAQLKDWCLFLWKFSGPMPENQLLWDTEAGKPLSVLLPRASGSMLNACSHSLHPDNCLVIRKPGNQVGHPSFHPVVSYLHLPLCLVTTWLHSRPGFSFQLCSCLEWSPSAYIL